MARISPTEESLGLGPTAEEMETITAPVSNDDDDDISRDDDPPEPTPTVAEPDKPVEPIKEPEKAPSEAEKVDLRALQEARAETRTERQLRATLEQRLNDVLAMVNQQQQPAQQKAPEIPGEDDVVGRINWITEQLQRQGVQSEEARQAQKANDAHQQTMQRLGSVEQQFRTTAPDYDQAVQFAGETRDRELQIMYPASTPQQREQYILREWQGIVDQSLRSGLNPAEQVYNLAKARGFAPPAPTPAPAPKTDLAAVAAAQQRHMSLSDAPGGEAVPPLDAKALGRMSDKDFRAWMSKKGNEAKFDEIMGR